MKKILFRFCLFFNTLLLSCISVFASEGLDPILVLNKLESIENKFEKEILSLNDEIEILRENQRLNSEKITELLQMIEINQSSSKKTVQSTPTTQNTESTKFFADGKNAFILGEYEKSIELFLVHLKTSPSSLSTIDTLLWLGRAYFYSGSFLNSKDSYLEYQSMGQDHPKFADSLYELSRVLIELDENVQAKLLLDEMLSEYPGHSLSSKASALLQNL